MDENIHKVVHDLVSRLNRYKARECDCSIYPDYVIECEACRAYDNYVKNVVWKTYQKYITGDEKTKRFKTNRMLQSATTRLNE